MSYRIAFAATGEYIDQHFGSARYWQICDIDDKGGTVRLEPRLTAAKCRGHCEGGFAHLLEALHDCDAIFASKIGEGAAAYMINNGKRVFEAQGEINAILQTITDSAPLLFDGG